jgi:nucleoid-associated protein YgaU
MPATSPAARAGVESSPALAVTAEPPANPETAKLIAQLNDASRELAILRATNARLSAERERDRDRERSLPRASEPVVRADPADEKLGASLKSFAALKQELSAFVTEMEQLRSENATFTSRLKEAQARADDAQSSLARLERELRAEKRSRQEAEQAAASLQEQLRAVARAVSSAGLNLDKATGEPSSTARLETNTSRPIKYKVKRGDTLESIAELYYGDASRWRVILDANRARLPLDGSLEVGAEIEIPRGR